MNNNTSSASRKQKTKTVPVVLYCDYWGEGGTRHPQGTTITVDVSTATLLMDQGKADRADPLPGEKPDEKA